LHLSFLEANCFVKLIVTHDKVNYSRASLIRSEINLIGNIILIQLKVVIYIKNI